MGLLNVRLSPDDERLAGELREEGIPISRIVREAIRTEHARHIGRRGRKKAAQIVDDVFAEFPEPARKPAGHGIDTTKRRAVQQYIAARLGRRVR